MLRRTVLLGITGVALVAALALVCAVHLDGKVAAAFSLEQKQNTVHEENAQNQQEKLREQLHRIIKAVAPRDQKLQAAFPGEPEDKLKVCEPWPSCCNEGKKTINCYGVITEGVLAPHTCTPYPYCCGHSWDNCFDANAKAGDREVPKSSDDAPSAVAVAELVEECEGMGQLAQCLTQTQSCLSTETAPEHAHSSRAYSIRHPWRETDACTCFQSSVYCSWPQSYQTCSPCPMACQKKLFALLNTARTDMSKPALHCPLFGGGEAAGMYSAEWRERDEEDTGLDMTDPSTWGLDDRLGGSGWDSMDVDGPEYGRGQYQGAQDNVGGEYYPPGGMYGHVYGRGRRDV